MTDNVNTKTKNIHEEYFVHLYPLSIILGMSYDEVDVP